MEERKERRNEGGWKGTRVEEWVATQTGGCVQEWTRSPAVSLTWTLDESPLLSEPRTAHMENGTSVPGCVQPRPLSPSAEMPRGCHSPRPPQRPPPAPVFPSCAPST